MFRVPWTKTVMVLGNLSADTTRVRRYRHRKALREINPPSFEAFIDILYVRIMAPSTILHSEYFAPNKYKTVLAGSFFNVLYSYSNSKLFHN